MLDLRTLAPDVPRPIRRCEYDAMVRMGMFEGERVELLEGVIVRISPHGPEHDGPIERLTEMLVRGLVPRATIRVQLAFAASDGSEPEPDLAAVPRRDWSESHPGEAYFIVEVASSSLAKDRATKAAIYAASGVPEYWIVNVVDGVVEVHTEPTGDRYARVTPFRRGQSVSPAAFPDLLIDVTAVLSGPT